MSTSEPALAPSPRHRCCERCHHWVLPHGPSRVWPFVEIGFWFSLPVALFVLKGFGVVVVPFILMFAGGLAGPLRTKADEPTLCPDCGAALPKQSFWAFLRG